MKKQVKFIKDVAGKREVNLRAAGLNRRAATFKDKTKYNRKAKRNSTIITISFF